MSKRVSASANNLETFVWGFEDETRARIIRRIGEAGPIGASQVAEDLDLPRRRTSRTASRLLEKGLIEVAGTKQRRGTRERLFRVAEAAGWLSDEQVAELPLKKKRKIFVAVVRPLIKNILSAVESSTTELRSDMWCVSLTRAVDEKGWRELAAIYHQASDDVLRVVEESAERLEGGGEDRLRISSSLFLFNIPDSDQPRQRVGSSRGKS